MQFRCARSHWGTVHQSSARSGRGGAPFPFSEAALTALFAEGYEIVEDYVPDLAFSGREGREPVRVLRRLVG